MSRKAIKQERLAILAEIDRLNESRCEECIDKNTNDGANRCECPSAVRIRELGEQLNDLAKAKSKPQPLKKPDQQNPKPPKAKRRKSFTAEEYWQLKNENLSDREICEKIGWSRTSFYNWKAENDLTHSTPYPKRAINIPDILNGLSVEEYRQLKNDGITDTHIRIRYNISASTFWRWKDHHKLIGYKRSDEMNSYKPGIKPNFEDGPPMPGSNKTIKDEILARIERQIDSQTGKGIRTYGHTLDACPMDKHDWLLMINEELIDALQYANKEIRRLREGKQ